MSTLANIRTKIRRITRSPSPLQLTDAQIDDYVNTFIQYDLPEHLRLFNLHRTLTWYTEPNIDTYNNNSIPAGLLNFDQFNLTINPPIYIAGNQVFFTQSREQFFNIYSMINSILATGFTGDGITVAFAGTLSQIPILRNNVRFVTINNFGLGAILYDDGVGNLIGDGNGAINYLTGAYILNFFVAPAVGQQIFSETVPYIASQPLAVLYYNNTFTVRPVPDKIYAVDMEVYVRPTQLIAAIQTPELEEWWQMISLGAAIKIFQDRMDMESVALIFPEFNLQQRLCLRRTLVQLSNERVATIYTENTTGSYGPGWLPGGGNF